MTNMSTTSPHNPEPVRPSVLAVLPPCPGCGVKDRARVTDGTYRPFGRTSADKVKDVVCRDCDCAYKIEWE